MGIERMAGIEQPSTEEALPQRILARILAAYIMVEAPKQSRAHMRIWLPRPEPANLVLLEDSVAAQQLVGAFPGQHCLDACALHSLRKEEQRHRRCSKKRRLAMPYRLG